MRTTTLIMVGTWKIQYPNQSELFPIFKYILYTPPNSLLNINENINFKRTAKSIQGYSFFFIDSNFLLKIFPILIY